MAKSIEDRNKVEKYDFLVITSYVTYTHIYQSSHDWTDITYIPDNNVRPR